jgi:predicted dehydrogenase
MSFRIALVGAGLIGNKRAAALQQFGNCRLKVVVDVNRTVAENLSEKFGAEAQSDWKQIIDRDNLDIVIVAVINKFLLPISIAALEKGKHVLCEKPLGRNSQESEKIIKAAEKSGVILKTGFNHRHHPAIVKAKELVEQGQIGRILYLRCRYGHGGRPGYEKEWRANKDLCGGGELLDQGVHVVDLFRWFAGDFEEAFGHASTCFWNMGVEDNSTAIFRRNDGVFATMHTSWTQWKNMFSFEIFGHDGYLVIEGLGGSYGTESLKIGKRRIEGGVPSEQTIKFPGHDVSWVQEWREFISAVENNKEPIGNGWDGYQANRMIDAVYRSSKAGHVIKI